MTWGKVLLTVACLAISLFFTGNAVATPTPEDSVLILYEGETRYGDRFPIVDALEEYIGHFDMRAAKLQRSLWKPGELSGYKTVFYLGTEKAVLPRELLSEMEKVPCLVWGEQNIDQYAQLHKWAGFKNEGNRYQFEYLVYRNKRLPYYRSIPLCCTSPPTGANVPALADDLQQEVPYIWRMDNLWYLGRIDFNFPINLIFSDLLHDIFNIDHPHSQQVLLRIEDVSPLTPPVKLSAIIDVIAKQRVPYAVGVIPAIMVNSKLITLEDTPDLVKVLSQVEITGGSIIQHGYIHENEYSPKDDEGFEFWNARDDTPIGGDEALFTRMSIDNGLKIFADTGIYPVAFELPHYATSSKGYQELSKHFSILSGQVQMSDESHTIGLDIPYSYNSVRAGMFVYPENLGYFDPSQVDTLSRILVKAEQFTVVRDCVAGVFFHSYLSPEGLDSIITGLKKLGYDFFDLRYASYHVEGESLKITSQNGQRSIWADAREIPDNNQLTGIRLIFKNWLATLAIAFTIIVVSLFLIIWTLQRNKKNLYEVEQKWLKD